MDSFKQTDKILILGRSGCGKSFLGKKIQQAFPRLVIFDITDEYPADQNTIRTFDEFTNFARHAGSLPRFKKVVKFSDELNQEQLQATFDAMLKILFTIGDMTIVIEEIQEYCSTHKLPEYLWKSMTRGRHRNLGFIITTQRPGQLHKTVLSQSTHVITGNLIDKNDVTTVATFLGRDSKEVSSLRDREFLWFCPTRENQIVKFKS